MDTLIFIDTNIILDFYRIRRHGVKLSFLNLVEDNLEKIITSEQVEMEYKKKRQWVVLESLKNTKTPNWNSMTTPAFLENDLTAKSISENRKEIDKKLKVIRNKIRDVLKNPQNSDPIYKTTQKLFKKEGSYILSRESEIYSEIFNLAKKRWILGYPPRKNNDNSIGDAINWEWIIKCAKDSGNNVVIVTRDTDFGENYNKKPILNDWLEHEFNKRVSRKQKLFLTNRLAIAFEHADIKVSSEIKKEEEVTIKEQDSIKQYFAATKHLADILAKIPDDFSDELYKAIKCRNYIDKFNEGLREN